MYLAIRWNPSNEQVLQAFTPKVMKWEGGVWLMDLRVCLPYWNIVAQQQGCSLAELLRDLLQQYTEDQTYLAAFAGCPWQAILLLNYLNERRLDGFVDRTSNFGSGLYRDISWQSWWQTALQWGSFCEQVREKRFNLGMLKRQLTQMRQAVENVGVASPWEMQAVGSLSIQRRYGRWVTLLWEWTFPPINQHLPEDGFPWVSYQPREDVSVQRWLDEPLHEWEQVCSDLRVDFNRMCDLATFTERQKLVCLEWRLTLHDASTVSIPIRFRHPHCLHREAPTHGTALLQANYAFEEVMQAKQKKSLEDTDSCAPPIIGWEILVKEQLVLPPQVVDLFGDTDTDDAALLRLENRLPVKLYHFDLRSDWSPEESYAVYGQDTTDEQDPTRHSLMAIAMRRPLFLYQKHVPLERRMAQSSLWQFTERTMNKWWKDHGAEFSSGMNPVPANPAKGDLAKDYYRYVDEKQRSLWVARGARNQWYVHGIFA